MDRGQTGAVVPVAHGDALAEDWRPPRGTDGPPNESSVDVMTRERELLSLLETQFYGDTVVSISPKGQASVIAPLRETHTQKKKKNCGKLARSTQHTHSLAVSSNNFALALRVLFHPTSGNFLDCTV